METSNEGVREGRSNDCRRQESSPTDSSNSSTISAEERLGFRIKSVDRALVSSKRRQQEKLPGRIKSAVRTTRSAPQ